MAVREQCSLKERDIFQKELFLQILGPRGDNDALAGVDGRHQIRQRLSRPRAGFDDQVPALANGLLHRLGHLQLPAPEFVSRVGAAKQTARGKEVVQRSAGAGGAGLRTEGHRVSIITVTLAIANGRAPLDHTGETPVPQPASSYSMTSIPLIAIVGRPNVGKSTLFNRLVGSRRAIVGDEPGITRDRIYGDTHWRGQDLRVVDTGGIIPEEKDLIPAEIFRQARVALAEAAAVVMVVDGRGELAAPDLELARLLQKTGKPLFLAVNKVDSAKQESLAEDFYRLRIPEIFPVSAERGRGVDELLDAILAMLGSKKALTPVGSENTLEQSRKPQEDATQEPPNQAFRGARDEEPGVLPTTDHEPATTEVKVAIIGHPNVGKSTLLNRLTGVDRAIVSPIPGTTRDAVDEMVERDGSLFRFIDTAGIRRKGKTRLMAEKLSVVMARKHLEAADIALLVIDATEGVSALDASIAGYAHESGRSMIIVVNKWDLVTTALTDGKPPADLKLYEEQVRHHLKFLAYAPVVFVSAALGKNTGKLFSTLELVAK